MDSRVPTEMIFDLGIGDLFSVRVAGNIAFEKAVGSLEFGCALAGAKLLLVLGHTRCGAIKATVDLVHQGKTALEATGCENLDSVTQVISSAIHEETETCHDRTSANAAFVDRVAAINVQHTIRAILDYSPTLKGLVQTKKIMIAGGLYDVSSGRVDFISVPEEAAPIFNRQEASAVS